MRNLFLFIYRFHAFFLFLFLEVICLVLIISSINFHRSAFLNASDEITGRVYKVSNEMREYLRLGDENQLLATENARLHNLMASAYYNDAAQVGRVKDTTTRQLYEFLPARVIQSSTNHVNNYIMIDKGSNHGIEPRMALIGPSGVVGRVKATSAHFAICYSLLNVTTTVGGRVRRDGSRGDIRWDGKDASVVQLNEIPRNEKLNKGDTIFTSGVSRIFPDNIPIGTIQSFELIEPGNFFTIEVRPTTDFRKLDYVYVVSNLMREEMDSILNETENVE